VVSEILVTSGRQRNSERCYNKKTSPRLDAASIWTSQKVLPHTSPHNSNGSNLVSKSALSEEAMVFLHWAELISTQSQSHHCATRTEHKLYLEPGVFFPSPSVLLPSNCDQSVPSSATGLISHSLTFSSRPGAVISRTGTPRYLWA
jgi:hypothetical protein